jgi:hypothetical protein
MSFGFGFALPAYPLRGGGGNNPFNQLGATLDLSFVDGATNVGDQLGSDTYTLNTDFITPEYQVAAQYAVWENGVGLAQKTFAQIVTFTRASTATYFNSAGTLTSAAVDEARFDYNPSTLVPLGFLIEEARTNSIRNNTMVGAVAGTPGTVPTNWFVFTALTGLTSSVVGTGTEGGVTYVDIRVNGTPSGVGSIAIGFDQNTGIPALNAQTWAQSTYLKLQAGSFAGITETRLQNDERSTTTYIRSNNSSPLSIGVAALNTQRFAYSFTLSGGASVAYTVPYILLSLSGAAIDITLRIGLPQLELGAFATSVIPTTTTALTRSADVASVNTLSPWYNATEGTLFAEGSVGYTVPGSAFPLLASLNDGTSSNRIETGYLTSAVAGFEVAVGGVAQAGIYPVTGAVTRKVAGAYKANDFAACVNGGAVGTDTSGSIPVVNRLRIGDRQGLSNINGYLRRITYYPRRLSNADLQTITL